jgi:hypothetical protein
MESLLIINVNKIILHNLQMYFNVTKIKILRMKIFYADISAW